MGLDEVGQAKCTPGVASVWVTCLSRRPLGMLGVLGEGRVCVSPHRTR